MAEVGFPVVLDLVDRPCLVVGGGRVASYKIQGLLGAKARVTVVALEACDAVLALRDQGLIALELRAYASGEAAHYDLITSATGIVAVDGAVSRDAKQAGRLINAADDPVHCNVLLPSVARRGPVTVAVSTTGSSPALAAWLRRQIEANLPNGIEHAASILSEARQRIREAGVSTEDVGFGSIVGPVVDLVAAGRIDEARALAFSLGSGPTNSAPD